ncbi:RICIN domain-containing protein, partial [Streptomyces bungoensis]|uniref:RICIN domain-containing protein n=1 Tax=Streptomyces bungoensis TaxID=285568 RepID=UPI000AEDF8B5
LAEAGTTLAPSPTPTPALTPAAPPQSAAAESPKAASDGGGKGGSGSGGGGGSSPAAPKKPATPVVPATNVLLLNPTTKKCADLPGYDKGTINGPVREFTCDGTTNDNQLWNLEVKYEKGGPGGRALFQIRNVKDQLCMDLPDYGAQPVRTAVAEFTCDGTTADNQLWWVQKQQDGAYWIRNFASDNKCLDVAGYSTGGNDANLTIFDCSNTDDQEWRIVHPAKG